ncbi:P3 [Colocasia bobone disease-associated virus]|uniref:p3 n=1 Tax=Colocasia bobone disease-associated virus TaxID=1775456 RepID=A0A0U3GZV2_9RHAB|nr:P3 [Colocasia bobone disease-associated virus]ALU34425.1 P3 [Colocasia bobone disease-associated virus]
MNQPSKKERGTKGGLMMRITNEQISQQIEIKTSASFMECIEIPKPYVNPQCVYTEYMPVITTRDIGRVQVEFVDSRFLGDGRIIAVEFPANRKCSFTVYGFDSFFADDPCPMAVNVNPKLTGIGLDYHVGTLIGYPQFIMAKKPFPAVPLLVEDNITKNKFDEKAGEDRTISIDISPPTEVKIIRRPVLSEY